MTTPEQEAQAIKYATADITSPTIRPGATEHPFTVQHQLVAIMDELEPIGKDSRVTTGPAKYPFRGIEAIVNALNPLLAKYQVVCTPNVVDVHHDWTESQNGARMRVIGLTIRYDFHGPAGDVISATTYGEQFANDDKAGNKAMSAALKYALVQSLMIPTEGIVEEGDSDSTPVGSVRDPNLMTETQFDTLKDQAKQGAEMFGREWDRTLEALMSGRPKPNWEKTSTGDAAILIAEFKELLEGEPFETP